MLDCSRQHLVNEVYSAVLLYIANWTANLAFALSEAKTKSSVCPAHICLSMGAWDNVTAGISDSVTPFCDFLLAVLSGLASFRASSGVFCSLTVPLTQNCAQDGFCFDLLMGRAAQGLTGWLPHSAAAPGVCPPLPPPASSSRPSSPRVQGKAPGEPQGYALTAKESPDNLWPQLLCPGRISQQRSHRNKLTLYQKH